MLLYNVYMLEILCVFFSDKWQNTFATTGTILRQFYACPLLTSVANKAIHISPHTFQTNTIRKMVMSQYIMLAIFILSNMWCNCNGAPLSTSSINIESYRDDPGKQDSPILCPAPDKRHLY